MNKNCFENKPIKIVSISENDYQQQQKKHLQEQTLVYDFDNNENINLNKDDINKEKQQNEEDEADKEDIENELNDLIELKKLNIDCILDVLEKRYSNENYYIEASSLTLIALNPYKNVDYLYSKKLIDFYNNNNYYLNNSNQKKRTNNAPAYSLSSLKNTQTKCINKRKLFKHPPNAHIYKCASIVWKNMMDYYENSNTLNNVSTDGGDDITISQNQTIIVSGISGSGKTSTLSYIMYFFTHILNTNRAKSIENVLLLANIILESFGNAKTVHNDNSSRFGKYIQLNFMNKCLTSVKINTYLLEKTRVTHMPSSLLNNFEMYNERNFHVFYQLISGANEQQKLKYGVTEALIYKLLQCDNINDNKLLLNDDKIKWKSLQNAFKQLNIDNTEFIYKIIIAIAHLNCCLFTYSRKNRYYNKYSSVSQNDDIDDLMVSLEPTTRTHLESAAQLLGFNTNDLENCLLVQELYIKNDNYKSSSSSLSYKCNKGSNMLSKPCNLNEVIMRKDCLIKLIYSNLFMWLVEKINENLNKILINNTVGNGIKSTQSHSSHAYRHAYISLLDLYGFENNNLNNSLQQLCINYANERLHQIYIDCFLKYTQNEYLIENIKWKKIDFSDNMCLIDSLDYGNNCLFNILNEECRLKRNNNIIRRIYNTTSQSSLKTSETYTLTTSTYSSYKLSTKIVNYLKQTNKIQYVTSLKKSHSPHVDLFLIKHYAGDVYYQIDYNLIEKNKDNIPKDLILFLNKTKNSYLAELLLLQQQQHYTTHSNNKNITVLQRFKTNLDELINLIKCTRIHYIKCIKPNNLFKSTKFDRFFVLTQLESSGILATINLYQSAYTNKLNYLQFIIKYIPILVLKSFKSEYYQQNNTNYDFKQTMNHSSTSLLPIDIELIKRKIKSFNESLLKHLTKSIANQSYVSVTLSKSTLNVIDDNDDTIGNIESILSNYDSLNNEIDLDSGDATTTYSLTCNSTAIAKQAIKTTENDNDVDKLLVEIKLLTKLIINKCVSTINNQNSADFYQFGKTKVFFKDKLAVLLDQCLNKVRLEAVKRIQNGWKYYKLKKSQQYIVKQSQKFKEKLIEITYQKKNTFHLHRCHNDTFRSSSSNGAFTQKPSSSPRPLLLPIFNNSNNEFHKMLFKIREYKSCPALNISNKSILSNTNFTQKKQSEISLIKFCLSSKCKLDSSDIDLYHVNNDLTIISKRYISQQLSITDCL